MQRTVVTGFIYKDGKVLVVRRSEKEAFLPGVYELPGGKLNFGEGPIDGLRREIREEVGLEIEPKQPFFVFSYVTGSGTKYTVEIVFLAEVVGASDPKLSAAHDTFAWIQQDEVEKHQISGEIKIAIHRGFEAVMR